MAEIYFTPSSSFMPSLIIPRASRRRGFAGPMSDVLLTDSSANPCPLRHVRCTNVAAALRRIAYQAASN
jgi:hypothetical protein